MTLIPVEFLQAVEAEAHGALLAAALIEARELQTQLILERLMQCVRGGTLRADYLREIMGVHEGKLPEDLFPPISAELMKVLDYLQGDAALRTEVTGGFVDVSARFAAFTTFLDVLDQFGVQPAQVANARKTIRAVRGW